MGVAGADRQIAAGAGGMRKIKDKRRDKESSFVLVLFFENVKSQNEFYKKVRMNKFVVKIQ